MTENPFLPPLLIEAANKVDPTGKHTCWQDIADIAVPLGVGGFRSVSQDPDAPPFVALGISSSTRLSPLPEEMLTARSP